MQNSGMIAAIGILLAVGDMLPILHQNALLFGVYWCAVLLLVLWVIALGVTDLMATASYSRVALARALVTQPDLLILDEPFAALDDLKRGQLNEELVRIWLEQRWTAAFVTHNVAEAVFLSQRILVMSSCPGTIIGQVAIPFDYPRSAELRSEPEFARICGSVSRTLRKDPRLQSGVGE